MYGNGILRRTLIALLLTATLVAGAAAATTVSVTVEGYASNDGDTPAYVAEEGGSSASVTADSDGNVDVQAPELVPTLRGVAAYVGYLSDGAQGGSAHIAGSVTVDGESCSFATGEGPVAGVEPAAECGILA